jgi:HAE1 family hydrophobic/amphiphilic exporter-1/multidrug efflux pump
LTRRPVPMMAVYAVLVTSMAALFARTPTAFLPDED